MTTWLEVHGMGAVGGWGRGFAHWDRDPAATSGTETGEQHSTDCDMALSPENPGGDADGSHPRSPLKISRVASDLLKDRVALKRLRRADRFSKMAALAAWDAACAAELINLPSPSSGPDGLGIMVATAFGPHRTTFAFLDDILDFGDASVSPTTFSHSVHNAAAAYIGIMLNRRGPTCTLTDFDNPLGLGLRTACQWLTEKRCTRVLTGYVEEISDPMETIAAARRSVRPAVNLQPFRLSPDPRDDISEGAVFLALSLPGAGGQPLDLDAFTGNRPITDLTALWRALPGVKTGP